MKSIKEFIDEHFNVLVLVCLFIGGAGVFLHTIHHSDDMAALNWVEHVSDQILAALLGMMVGRITTNGGSAAPVTTVVYPAVVPAGPAGPTGPTGPAGSPAVPPITAGGVKS